MCWEPFTDTCISNLTWGRGEEWDWGGQLVGLQGAQVGQLVGLGEIGRITGAGRSTEGGLVGLREVVGS